MNYFLFFIGAFLFLFTPLSHATQSYGKLWGSTIITGPLAENSNFRYYWQSDLRLINDPYVFNQLLLLPGIGYQFNPKLAFYTGMGWVLDKTPQGNVNHENRYWQQFNWLMIHTNTYNLNDRSRLEEIKNLNYSQMAYRFRERLWLRVPFKTWPTYSFSCFDEVFLNINNPSWASPYLFAQNRAFLGIGTQVSKNAIVDIGYLNQYVHSTTNQLNNVLFLSLTANL